MPFRQMATSSPTARPMTPRGGRRLTLLATCPAARSIRNLALAASRRSIPVGDGAIASAFGLIVEPNGKIVIAGSVGTSAAAFRMTPTGSLDTTFGKGGVASTLYVSDGVSDPSEATAVAVNAAGDIFIDERRTGGDGSGVSGVVRFLPNGKIDPSFGNRGTLVTDSSDADINGSSAMALAPNGQIVVGGSDGSYTATEIGATPPTGWTRHSASCNSLSRATTSPPTAPYTESLTHQCPVLLIGADGKIYAAAGSDVFRVLSK